MEDRDRDGWWPYVLAAMLIGAAWAVLGSCSCKKDVVKERVPDELPWVGFGPAQNWVPEVVVVEDPPNRPSPTLP